MKKIVSAQSVINQYIETCFILKETTLKGDYKRGNREGEKIVKIFKILEKNLDIARESLPFLFANANVVARTKAAAHCIALNIFVDEAVRVLEDAANDATNGIFGFNAEMTLKVWRERGYLKVYPAQEAKMQ